MEDITSEILAKYLSIYVADIDWGPHLNNLYQRNRGDAEATKKRAVQGLLLPFYEGKYLIDNKPEDILFKKYTSFADRDWESEFRKILQQDQKITEFRNKLLDLGIIYPIEYNPNTRQAFRWLRERSEVAGEYTDKTPILFSNFVYAYGGAAICNIFLKPELETKLIKLYSWRTAYFFEKLIYEVYTQDQILKIKTHEIEKVQKSDSNLVKKIKK